ncbi:hypothetical protein [Microbacterium sp. 4-7]|uniref:hypothetical protein n=1 Tax=Microbacterium sp. 4-7 TaxID=1885327 RepID=UPI00164EF16F|nr:hypothetical protein [Microbacterium sp. 4-7]
MILTFASQTTVLLVFISIVSVATVSAAVVMRRALVGQEPGARAGRAVSGRDETAP